MRRHCSSAACESVRLDADFVQSFVHNCRNNSQPGTPVAAPKTPNNCSPSTVGSSEAMDQLGFIPDLVCRWIEIIEGLVKPPDATALAKSSLGSEFAVMHWEENEERPLGPLVWRPRIIKRVRKNQWEILNVTGTEHLAEESYKIEEEWIEGSSLRHPNDTEIWQCVRRLMANRQR